MRSVLGPRQTKKRERERESNVYFNGRHVALVAWHPSK